MVHFVYRPSDLSTKTTFKKVTVQGGGKLKIETEGQGMTLQGETFIVESGGDIEVDRLDLIADTLTIEDSAKITANGKVRKNCWCVCGNNIVKSNLHEEIYASMSRLMTKPTKWHVRPAKTLISLSIRPV